MTREVLEVSSFKRLKNLAPDTFESVDSESEKNSAKCFCEPSYKPSNFKHAVCRNAQTYLPFFQPSVVLGLRVQQGSQRLWVCNPCSRYIFSQSFLQFFRLSQFAQRSFLLYLFQYNEVFIRPIIEYGSLIYSPTLKCLIKKLESVQKNVYLSLLQEVQF